MQPNTILSPFSCRTFEHSFGAHSKKWKNMAIPSISLCMTQIWPKVADCDDREVLHPKFVRGDRFVSASSFYPIFGKWAISKLFSKNARKYWLCNRFYSASNHVSVQQTYTGQSGSYLKVHWQWYRMKGLVGIAVATVSHRTQSVIVNFSSSWIVIKCFGCPGPWR